MRFILLAVLLALPAAAHSQPGSDWSNVQTLPTETLIRVASLHRRPLACNFVAADANSLTCTRTRTVFFFPITHRILYRRTEVLSIKLSRHFLSVVSGAGIGAAVGAGIGVGLQSQQASQEDGNLLLVVTGFLGAVLGGGIGSATDFLAAPTIYRVS